MWHKSNKTLQDVLMIDCFPITAQRNTTECFIEQKLNRKIIQRILISFSGFYYLLNFFFLDFNLVLFQS